MQQDQLFADQNKIVQARHVQYQAHTNRSLANALYLQGIGTEPVKYYGRCSCACGTMAGCGAKMIQR